MTDPTITIAGLEARINSLRSAVQHSNRTAAERMTMFVEASSNADRLTAERDALAAQLAEVRAELQAAQTDLHAARRSDEDEIDVLRADLASERAHLAACRTRIAGLEQAADERSREDKDRGARMDEIRAALGAHPFASDGHIADRIRALTARVAELEARPVLDVGRLAAALNQCELGPRASDIMRHLGPVTLPAQDRAEELTNAYVDEWNGRSDCRGDA